MFLDKVKIKIQAGNGGDGAVSFHRTKLTMNGGPDGGNGGKGGDILFVAKNDLNTLYSFKFRNLVFLLCKHIFQTELKSNEVRSICLL